jgi:cell division protein FtsB
VPDTTEHRRRRPTQPRSHITPDGSKGHGVTYYILLFVACALLVVGLAGDRGLLAMIRARREYSELAAAVVRIRQENARLREEVRRLRDDPAAIEDLARRELGLMRPGEKVFIIKDAPGPAPAPAPTPFK